MNCRFVLRLFWCVPPLAKQPANQDRCPPVLRRAPMNRRELSFRGGIYVRSGPQLRKDREVVWRLVRSWCLDFTSKNQVTFSALRTTALTTPSQLSDRLCPFDKLRTGLVVRATYSCVKGVIRILLSSTTEKCPTQLSLLASA